jgi:Calcineurin-like phosphoesterase
MRVRIAIPILLIVICSCKVSPEVSPRFSPALEAFDPGQEGWVTTRPILFVADCQIHNLYSKPIPDRNLSIKLFVNTAIRPPQLDMFESDALRWILRNTPVKTDSVIHLGDAVDLACEGEFRRFLDVMKDAGKPWLMIPGNHDCFYFGSYDPRNPPLWEDACYGAGRPLTKDLLIRLYVAALVKQDAPGTKALAKDLGLYEARDEDLLELADRVPMQYSWEAPADLGSFLKAIVWNIDGEKPWRSFVLQRADLSGPEPRVRLNAILMDSTQYAQLPALVPNAWDNYPLELDCGMTGEMLADQLRLVREWMEISDGTRFVLILHHPFDEIASKSRSSLRWLWGRYAFGGIVTAHTHAGYFEQHALEGGVEGLEINVGSTTDWPMDWRTLAVHGREDRKEAYLETRYFTLVDVLKNRQGFFLPEWETQEGDRDDYRRYRVGEPSGITIANYLVAYHLWPPALGRAKVKASKAAIGTETQVKDTMLWTYHRLIRTFPTDTAKAETLWPGGCRDDEAVKMRIEAEAEKGIPILQKITFLMELERFEKTRSTRDPKTGESTDEERYRFKLSQAVWASRYELAGGRGSLRPQEELIRVRAGRQQVGKEEPAQPE